VTVQIHTILVPTDFSRSAEHALERARQLAHLTRADVHLLHAYELPVQTGLGDPVVVIPQDFFDQVRDTARGRLDEVAAKIGVEGIDVQTHLVCDSPMRAILETAQSIGASLIVMGTHGHTGVARALLGSVTERTVRLAHCPVLTVKAVN
jgi:nucleotide-binding universal stress UspA family protein